MPRMRITDDEVIERPFNMHQLRRMLRYLLPYKKQVAFSLLLMVVSALCGLAGPYLLMIAIDDVIGQGRLNELWIIAASLLGCSVLGALCVRYRVRIMEFAGRKAIARLRQDLFDHIQNLALSFFDNRSAGKIMVRVINDVNSLNDLMTNGVINVAIDVFTLVFVLILMFSINAWLTLISLSTVPLMLLVIFWLKRRMRKSWQKVRIKISNMNGYLHESLAGMRVTQSFVREEVNAHDYIDINNDIRASWMHATHISMLFWPAWDIVSVLGSMLVYYTGAQWVTSSAVTVGSLLAIISYLSRFWEPLNNMSNIYNQVLVAMASLERIYEIMDTPVDIRSASNARIMPPIEGGVRFDDVSFAYDKERLVLKNVSFDVAPGQTVALVGPTGAGKSTVVNLVSRFYDVTDGRVLIDGLDIRDVELHSLRAQMGIMLQDSFIFSGTIMDNIRYGKLDAADDEVIAAAKAVLAHDFIMQMEKGYLTEVNERGSRLSVGQKQLISFARALLANPRILILDEATSSIDTHTEILIQQALERLLQNRTSFVIAHRLSTIRKADCIMVIDDGRIIERGTHEELIELKGHYYELCQAQYRFLNAAG